MSDAADQRVGLIVAVSDNGVIGKGNALPWRLSADLRYFKQRTMGKPIIMGRKTWQSIGRALPGRHNIVISRDPDFTADGADTVASIDAAIAACEPCEEIMIIGGAAIYTAMLPMVDTLYLTRVHVHVDGGDAFFDAIDASEWLTVCEHHCAGEKGQPACTFFVYERRQKPTGIAASS
ncbi:MAG: dihydrofolate reductase [Pseudomonadota bacterium]